MPRTADILIVGGGVAGMSAAAELAAQAKVVALEAEEQVGFHSSGRSATMLHYALGNPLVRALTRASRAFFDAAPDWFGPSAVSGRLTVLVHGRESEKAEIDQLEQEVSTFAPQERLDADGLRRLCPLLKTGPDDARHGIADHDALKLDGNALLQGYARGLRARGGEIRTSERVAGVARQGDDWLVRTERGEEYSAPILVNAAGAWADRLAAMAGVASLGIQPMRRTIITFDPPEGFAVAKMPFVKTVGDELYFGNDAGRLYASPMDEEPSDPCDAQADEMGMALAAYRMEERTTVQVRRIVHRWAGLRSFAPDRSPVVGFAPDAPGFFWLAGQGGSGLQTAPALAAAARSLITGEPWQFDDVGAEELSPSRFVRQRA